jgi:uncharacterized protein YoxC
MEVFQSWADIVIPSIIAIAYIVTAIAQYKTIQAHKATIDAQAKTIEGLQAQIGAAKAISDMQGTNFNTYRDMLKLDDINEHIEIKVSVRVEEAITTIIPQVIKDMETDTKLIAKAAEWISEDLAKFCNSNFQFMLFIFKINNTSDEMIKWTVNKFFGNHPGIEKMFSEEMTKFRDYKETIRISELGTQTDQKKD